MTAQKQPIRVALVDDHVLLRDALAEVINNFEGFTVSHKAQNGEELLRQLQQTYNPDVVLLDLNMPQMDGYETARWLNINCPAVHVLVLTMYDTEVAMIRLLRAGVRGFIKKDVHPSELRQALENIVQHGYHYSNDTTLKLASLFREDRIGQGGLQVALMTDKEMNFLRLACTEMTYKEIAENMHYSPKAIDALRNTLFEKLGVKSRIGLVMYAIKNNIVNI